MSDWCGFEAAEVHFPERGLLLLVGANNAGKSALLSAIDVVASENFEPVRRRSGSSVGATIQVEWALNEADRRSALIAGLSASGGVYEERQLDRWFVGNRFGRIGMHYRELAGVMQQATYEMRMVATSVTTIDHDGYELTLADVQAPNHATDNLTLGSWTHTGIELAQVLRDSQHVDPDRLSGAVQEIGLGSPLQLHLLQPYWWMLGEPLSVWRSNYFHADASRPGTSATRELVAAERLDSSGVNVANVLLRLSTTGAPAWERVRDVMSDLVPDVGLLLTPAREDSLSVEFRDPHLGVDRNLKDLGTGVEQLLLTVVAAETAADGALIVVEEPESHLHPEAQRRLLHHMLRWAERLTLVVSTHSSIFLDRASQSDVSVILVRRSGGVSKAETADPSYADVLENLGVRLSDVLSAERILAVEGPSDVEILRVWFEERFAARSVSVVAADGGRTAWEADRLASWIDAADTLARPVQFLRDRDELSNEQVDRLERSGRVRVLKRRELENYLLDSSAITAVLNERCPEPPVRVDGDDVGLQLRTIADSRRHGILIKRVSRRIALPRLLDHSTEEALIARAGTVDDLIAQLRGAVDELHDADVRRCWHEEEQDLEARWEAEWMSLAAGSDLLEELWRSVGLRYDKVRDGRLVAEQMSPHPELLQLVEQLLPL